MSFGHILNLKKKNVVENKVKHYECIIVGADLFALAAYKKMKDKSPDLEIKILSPYEITKDHLRFIGPSAIRGEDNLKVIHHCLNNFDLKLNEEDAVFYKDQKFRVFGKRSKSEPLKYNEDYFIKHALKIKENCIFPFLDEDCDLLIAEFNADRLSTELQGINRIDPTDLLNNEHWELECSDGCSRTCQNLFWAQGPYSFLQLFNDKEKLSNKFIEFAESTHRPSTLSVEFLFEAPITDKSETLFLPLSYTHEWGHFIGEFIVQDDGTQKAIFSTFIDEDHTTEEYVSRKIRILKKNLEKIFTNFSDIPYTEYIVLSDQTACLKIDDNAFWDLEDNFEKLHFIGQMAPVKNNWDKGASFADSVVRTSHVARGVISLQQQFN